MTTNDKQKAAVSLKRRSATAAQKRKVPPASRPQESVEADKRKAAPSASKRKVPAVGGKQPAPAASKSREEAAAEKRQHPRKPLRLSVQVTGGPLAGSKLARDISLGGMFLETAEEMTPGQEIQLSIPFTNQDRQIKINGKVVRITGDGVGVQFDIYSIDIE